MHVTIYSIKNIVSATSKRLHSCPYKKRTPVPCRGGALDPFWGVLATCSCRGSLFPAPIPLYVSFCAWTIHGLPAQSKDPYFVQDSPWMVQIHTLSLTYRYNMCVSQSVCLSCPKMRRRNYLAQTRSCSKSDLGG